MEKKEDFLKLVRDAFERSRPAYQYYPGSAERVERIVAAASQTVKVKVEVLDTQKRLIEEYGPPPGDKGHAPRVFLTDLDPAATNPVFFEEEAFAGVLMETALEGKTSSEFLQNAVKFVNESLVGNLCCQVIIHPKAQKNRDTDFVDSVVGQLKFGAVAINIMPAVINVYPKLMWGAYPGNLRNNIISGQGAVHNVLMFDKIEKSVMYAPFHTFPKTLHPSVPPWFVNAKSSTGTSKALMRFSSSKSALDFLSLATRATFGS